VKSLTDLETLDLSGSAVTDAGLTALKDLKKLRKFTLFNTAITDKGLAYIGANMTQIEWLYLDRTKITDAGLDELKTMTHLYSVVVPKTISDDPIARLRKALPKAHVDRAMQGVP